VVDQGKVGTEKDSQGVPSAAVQEEDSGQMVGAGVLLRPRNPLNPRNPRSSQFSEAWHSGRRLIASWFLLLITRPSLLELIARGSGMKVGFYATLKGLCSILVSLFSFPCSSLC